MVSSFGVTEQVDVLGAISPADAKSIAQELSETP